MLETVRINAPCIVLQLLNIKVRASLVFILRGVTRFAGFLRRLVKDVINLLFDRMLSVWEFRSVTNNCNLNHVKLVSKYLFAKM